jgi:glycosyltransferase involved in cell wall biosynthesis
LWTGGGIKNRIYEALDKFWIRFFGKIVTVSDELRIEVLNRGVSKNRVTTIYNGININRFNGAYSINDVRKKFNIPAHFNVIGTIGRLNEQKGHIFLIKSAQQILEAFPECIFIIVGDGPLKQTLSAEVVEAKLENHFKFTGVLEDIPEILAAMDLFVLPSMAEGLPIALLEAMAAKKPIIATKVGAIPKVVIPNESGLLITPKNVSGLINSVTELLGNKNKARMLGENGYRLILQKFSSKIMAQKYTEVYESLLPTS